MDAARCSACTSSRTVLLPRIWQGSHTNTGQAPSSLPIWPFREGRPGSRFRASRPSVPVSSLNPGCSASTAAMTARARSSSCVTPSVKACCRTSSPTDTRAAQLVGWHAWSYYSSSAPPQPLLSSASPLPRLEPYPRRPADGATAPPAAGGQVETSRRANAWRSPCEPGPSPQGRATDRARAASRVPLLADCGECRSAEFGGSSKIKGHGRACGSRATGVQVVASVASGSGVSGGHEACEGGRGRDIRSQTEHACTKPLE